MKKRTVRHAPAAPVAFPATQPVALDPASLQLAYRRAVQSGKQAPTLAQSQFVRALQKLRRRVRRPAPILRGTTVNGVAVPRNDPYAFAFSEWLQAVFWRRQNLFNEGVAAVINEWPHHAASVSAMSWLVDEMRPHVRSVPVPSISHRGGVVLPAMIWGAKGVATTALWLSNRQALEWVWQSNELLYESLECLLSVEPVPEARLERLVERLVVLTRPEKLRFKVRLGFAEQERFVREAALALASLLLPGEGALEPIYAAWRTEEDARQGARLAGQPSGKVSFVFAQGEHLTAALESLQCQAGEWDAFVQGDAGARVVQLAAQAGPLQSLCEQVTGDWVALVTEPASFAPHAVGAVLEAAKAGALRLAYSDHDQRVEGGYSRPFFKPGWSPELFFDADYLGGVVFVARDVFQQWARKLERFDALEVAKLVLQLHDKREMIGRVPHVLWHREAPQPTVELGPLLREWAKARGETVEVQGHATGRRVKWKVRGEPLVSIIVPFKDKPELLEQLLRSFGEHERWRKYEFILVSNNSKNAATSRFLSTLKGPQFQVREWDHPFNYQAINNHAVREWARGEHLLFLNNDISWAGPGVLEEMLGHSQRRDIGAVGVNLRFPRGRLQHAGVALGIAGFAAHPFSGVRPEARWTAYGLPSWTRNYLAVTGACLMMRRAVFDEVKGFDEQLVVSGGDVDLCLRVFARGYRIVNTPHVQVIHHESATRSGMVIPDSDAWGCYERFQPHLTDGDPYYHPNLTLTSQDVLPRLDERTAEELALQLLTLELPSSRRMLP